MDPKKQTSERRRQQNVRAQQKYSQYWPCSTLRFKLTLSEGEKQKQHIKALESQITAKGPRANLTSFAAEGDDAPQTPFIHPRALGSLVNSLSEEDDEINASVRSGDTTLADIIRAGLAALRTQRPVGPPVKSLPGNTSNGMILRTDRILVPRNKIQPHSHSSLDAHQTKLHFKLFNNVTAFRTNTEELGVPFQDILRDKAESPFYKEGVNEEEAQEIAASSRFNSLKSGLRPSSIQIRLSHHAWLDTFPCSIFRANAIRLISMDPPMIDEDELCADIVKDGLICWGSYLEGDEETSGSGAPWDLRSWEAQPWFLKKWWIVVGGEEGPLFQQTRWWHELRGDRLPHGLVG